jgi:hypothetical protein
MTGAMETTVTSAYGVFALTRHASDGSLTVTYRFNEAAFGDGGTNQLTADAYDELAIWVYDGHAFDDPLIYEIHIDVA